MTIPSHPMILAYEIFYFEAGKTYYLPGSKQRILLTASEYDKKIEEYRGKNIQYMLLYDYLFTLKKDKWEAVPESIDMDEVDFYYELSIINEEEYMLFTYLHSEYAEPKG